MNDEKKPPEGRSPLFVITVLIVFAASTYLSLQFYNRPEFRMAREWRHDLDRLKKAGSLPESFQKIKVIKITSRSAQLKDIGEKLVHFMPTNSDGTVELDIFLDQPSQTKGILIQYDLVDIKSGNTVWEISRTLPLSL